jgi:hypothetical protein
MVRVRVMVRLRVRLRVWDPVRSTDNTGQTDRGR